MFKLIFLVLFFNANLRNSKAADAWDQCGGEGWTGSTTCPPGFYCYQRSRWYAQCRPDCPWDWDCNAQPQTTRRTDPNPGNNLVSETEFVNAVTRSGYPRPSSDQYRNYVTQLGPKGLIYNKREAAMYLTQILWESDGLRAKEEYACIATGCPGQYTTGIGYPGKNYYGRGYIQLSWDYNYRAASFDLYGDDRLLRNPELVAQNDEIAWATAFWYWAKNVGIVWGVQQGQFGASTNAINGALECRGPYQDKARKRFDMYKIVLPAFNVFETPIETGCYN